MDLKSPLVHAAPDASAMRSSRSRLKCLSKVNLVAGTSIAILMLSNIAERVLFKIMVDRMMSFRYFIAQTITFLYLPPLFIALAYKMTHTANYESEMADFPTSKMLLMATLDLLHTLPVILAGGNTPAPLTVILLQAIIPFTVFFSTVIYKSPYSIVQNFGALVVFIGCSVAIFPLIPGMASSELVYSEAAWSSFVYLLAAIPGSLSIIYKERAISRQPMDLCYLNAWVTLYQFILGLLVAPMIFDASLLHLNQLSNGFDCFFKNSQVVFLEDNCEHGFLIVLAFIASTVAMNACILWVMGQSSITSMYGAVSISFPLAYGLLELYQSYHNEKALNEYWVNNLISVVIVMVGIGLYRSAKEPNQEILTLSAAEMEEASLLDDDDLNGTRYS